MQQAAIIRISKNETKLFQFPPIPLQPGTCVWVNSGAPIPEGT